MLLTCSLAMSVLKEHIPSYLYTMWDLTISAQAQNDLIWAELSANHFVEYRVANGNN